MTSGGVVTGQQLSVRAARTIVSRIEEHFGGRLPSPAELLAADPQVLRASGLSGRKGETLRALAERFVDGRLSEELLSQMTDDEVEAVLTQVPGIGPWTAHGFLLVALDRPDVFLSGDVALQRAIQRTYRLDHPPTEDEMLEPGGALAAVPEPRRELPVRIPIRGRRLMNRVDRAVGILVSADAVAVNPRGREITGRSTLTLTRGYRCARRDSNPQPSDP